MKQTIELKHVGPKDHVRGLIQHLIDRLEKQLRHFPQDALAVHVVFEENASHKLYRTSVTCHIPRRILVAHEEDHDPGVAIKDAFFEVEHQIDRYKTVMVRKKRLQSRVRFPEQSFPEVS